jgi:hypothetical protein
MSTDPYAVVDATSPKKRTRRDRSKGVSKLGDTDWPDGEAVAGAIKSRDP